MTRSVHRPGPKLTRAIVGVAAALLLMTALGPPAAAAGLELPSPATEGPLHGVSAGEWELVITSDSNSPYEGEPTCKGTWQKHVSNEEGSYWLAIFGIEVVEVGWEEKSYAIDWHYECQIGFKTTITGWGDVARRVGLEYRADVSEASLEDQLLSRRWEDPDFCTYDGAFEGVCSVKYDKIIDESYQEWDYGTTGYPKVADEVCADLEDIPKGFVGYNRPQKVGYTPNEVLEATDPVTTGDGRPCLTDVEITWTEGEVPDPPAGAETPECGDRIEGDLTLMRCETV